jgi:hypothetical protein
MITLWSRALVGRPEMKWLIVLGVSGGGPTSEFVRQELRAVVGARTGQAQTAPNRTQSQLLNQPQVDLEALGLTFELPTTGASDSPKLWGTMGSDMAMSPQPATSRVSQASHKPFLLHACPACSVTNCLHVEQRPLYANVQQNEIRLANRQCSVT